MPKRVYLQPKDLQRSAHHTAYAGNGPIHEDGGGQLYKLEFVNGVAENVDDQLYARFKDLGIAGPTRPKAPDEEG